MLVPRRAALALGLVPFIPRAAAAADFISNIPRHEVLILENPGAPQNPDWFNIWAPGGGFNTNGLQQGAMDALWYINPEFGAAEIWENALAAEKPIYNEDFTEMTVKLRSGIHWSDGVEFTSADLVYTVQTQIDHPGMVWSAPFSLSVTSMVAPDPRTVVFKLKRPNSRFHTIFTVRWNAAWIMPKHVFEAAGDPLRFNFNKPVSLGPYVLNSYDPNGRWYIWQLREDWQRTSLARLGQPAVKYVAYVDAGPSDKRVIAQLNHNLDVINDVDPESMFTIAKESRSSRAWYAAFPYAHPDPTLPAVLLNHQVEPFEKADVRWALALTLDIRAVAMAAYRGAATISALGVPPTGSAPDDYFRPMEAWLREFELDTGKARIKPYDPGASAQLANMLRTTYRDAIPTEQAKVEQMFGFGWWRPNAAAAAELLERAGLRRQGRQWTMPDGKPFQISLLVRSEAYPVLARAASVAVQQWRQFGIDAKVVNAGTNYADRLAIGDFQAALGWSVETWGGHPDLSYFLDSWHSEFLQTPGRRQPARNWQRWKHPELDSVIERTRAVNFDDPKVVELGQEYLKLAVREMPTIPLMAYNKFAPLDTTYWTGYPTAENPYVSPGPYWANSRYMIARLRPAQR
jgi:peptide/nickel transport system substrate-binding protein